MQNIFSVIYRVNCLHAVKISLLYNLQFKIQVGNLYEYYLHVVFPEDWLLIYEVMDIYVFFN